MKIYTRPRLNAAGLLRPGDQIALHDQNGTPIGSESAYVDADLIGKVRWAVVHESSGPDVRHTLGEWTPRRQGDGVITREMVEVDPFTYLTRTDTAASIPSQR